MQTPVLLIVFNRPQTTREVFEAIRKAKPPRLYISSDGPRNQSDILLIEQITKIVGCVDWDCQVTYRKNTVNMGLRRSIVDAIDWFFSYESEGIILEDDIVPSAEFFEFCEKNLSLYRDDLQIMHISGYLPCVPTNSLYNGVTNFVFTWGWATWKCSWEKYIQNYNGLGEYLKNPKTAFKDKLWSKDISMYMLDKFIKCHRYEIDAWDYGWQYSILKNNGLCIHPGKSLITNIGFGGHATNTFKPPKLKTAYINPIGPNKKNEEIFFRGLHKDGYRLILRRLLPFLFYKFKI